MNILVLTNGMFYYGGYATIALKLYNILSNKYKVAILSILLNDNKHKNNNLYININYSSSQSLMNFKNCKFSKNKHVVDSNYNLIICTSPIALLFASYKYINNKILYIKGGGLCNDEKIEYLKNVDILKILNIDEYWDKFTLELENISIHNHSNIMVLPTVQIMYDMMNISNHILYKKSLQPINFCYFDSYKLNNHVEKKYDLIYVVSDHNRRIKNSSLVVNIFNNFSALNKLVIGKNGDMFNNISNTVIVNNIVHMRNVYKYFLETKILLIPSFFDTGPSTLIESILYGCIPIAYHNCGYSRFDIGCHVINNLDINDWCNKITYTISNYDQNNSIYYSKKLNKMVENDIDKIYLLCDSVSWCNKEG